MSEVIALDPERLRGLEVVLGATAERWSRLGGRVADEVAATGLPVDTGHITGMLHRLSVDLVAQRDDAAWRRVAVEAMDGVLPLPEMLYIDPSQRDSLATTLADRMEAATRAGWELFQAVLDDVTRYSHDPEFMAAFFGELDPEVAAALWTTAEELFKADREARGLGPSEAASAEALGVYEQLSEALRLASLAEGDAALSEEWMNSFVGLDNEEIADRDVNEGTVSSVADGLQKASWGANLASKLAQVAGRGGLALGLGVAGAVVGIVRLPLLLLEGDGSECDAPETMFAAVAAGLGTFSVVTSPSLPVAAALGAGSLFFGALSALMSGDCGVKRSTRNDDFYNPGTGRKEKASGSQSNGEVNVAGVPGAGRFP